MDETISATEANREFSRVLRRVEEGASFVVTSHGRPVARLVPLTADEKEAERDAAWADLLKHLESRRAFSTEPWTREDLYD
jgi:prevent-host-death family protein